MHPLKKWRLDRGITQEALASKICGSQENISCYERGIYTPSLQIAVAIERFTEGAVTARMMAEWRPDEDQIQPPPADEPVEPVSEVAP